jgi:hypothetical protein
LDENEKTDSLNKAFIDDNSENKIRDSMGKTQDSSIETLKATNEPAKPSAKGTGTYLIYLE